MFYSNLMSTKYYSNLDNLHTLHIHLNKTVLSTKKLLNNLIVACLVKYWYFYK